MHNYLLECKTFFQKFLVTRKTVLHPFFSSGVQEGDCTTPREKPSAPCGLQHVEALGIAQAIAGRGM
jgi:hypothetical protein